MPVYAPWPISTCLAITVTMLSEPIRKKAFGVKAPPGDGVAAPAARARRAEPVHSNPIVSAAAAAVPALFKKVRRVDRRTALGWVAMIYALMESAAAWMAARMRLYVPQRQMLPLMALSMSASLGVELVSSSAAADMICPDWQ